MQRFLASMLATILVAQLGLACAPDGDECEGVACAADRICVSLSTGPQCVCPAETGAADGGPCEELVEDAPEDAGVP